MIIIIIIIHYIMITSWLHHTMITSWYTTITSYYHDNLLVTSMCKLMIELFKIGSVSVKLRITAHVVFLLQIQTSTHPPNRSAFYTTRSSGCKFHSSARNSSWPLAVFQPISTFGRPKSILVSQIYCTFSMGWQSITYKMYYILNPCFYHWVRSSWQLCKHMAN